MQRPGRRPDALVLLDHSPSGPCTFLLPQPPTQHPQMDVQDYFDADICDLSGATEDLSFCRLIDLDAAQGDVFDLKSLQGLYRYVFIPFTDAARALQDELNLQPQTLDDLNGGIYPLDSAPIRPGTDSFLVLECAAHPFSICVGANKVLWKRSTELTGQWHNLVGQLMEHWIYDVYDPPRWFLESPVLEDVYEDVELTPSVASGYAPELLGGETRPDPSALRVDSSVEESDYRRVVADWTCNKVIYGLPPPEEEPIRTGRKSRRSVRLHECPCDGSPTSPTQNRPPSSPTRGDSPPSPTRNVPDALIACCRNYEVDPPSWVERHGGFPTHMFSSNDWAFFQYGIHLPGSSKT
ncbi:hypothetical protein K525DRAFT_274265 [Schizophyllum commune Loenen D]|nr:hypothetical protein K525DRAFT_274265 [Schizophyllum commune Loenen D]